MKLNCIICQKTFAKRDIKWLQRADEDDLILEIWLPCGHSRRFSLLELMKDLIEKIEPAR